MEGEMRCDCNVMDENPLFVLHRVCRNLHRKASFGSHWQRITAPGVWKTIVPLPPFRMSNAYAYQQAGGWGEEDRKWRIN